MSKTKEHIVHLGHEINTLKNTKFKRLFDKRPTKRRLQEFRGGRDQE